MDENDFLERIQEQFGFTEFVLVGLTPAESGDKEMDDMHVVSGPYMHPLMMMALLHEAIGNLLHEVVDEAPPVH
jgi:hypothetical protein